MRIRTTIPVIILSLLFASVLPAAQRGIKVTAKTPTGKSIPLYSGSYALVIGNGDYTEGWDPLPGAIRDVKDVARALKDNGFKVILKKNLTRNGFRQAFGRFFHKYGKNKTNRLFFYYAGHGYTQKMYTGEDQGYLVMVDAPAPEKDPVGFDIASIDMQVVVTQAKKVKARHVLFMFDSCFSGAILNLRERVIPEAISDSVSLPVRQFITAGRANEPVPDHSIFKQAFLDLLEGRDKEPIPDGYITGEELGLYLKNKVPEYNANQHPQYGKIKDIRLDKGDFVFALKMPSVHQAPAMKKSVGTTNYDSIIREREANRKKWDAWQSRIENDLSRVEQYDRSAHLTSKEKIKAWESFLGPCSSDNPYTERDDGFRRKAIERIRYWKGYKPSGKLFVDTIPSNATIKILNIGPKFYQGMELKPGRYHVEASKRGYKTQKMWVQLDGGEDKKVAANLEQFQASIQPTTNHTRPTSSTSNVIQLDSIPFPKPKGLINDFANVIAPAYKQKIAAVTGALLQQTGIPVVVVTMPDIGGAEYNDYANRLYKAWGIGKKGEDKGVLIFVTMKERKMRIETGYGVEGILPDGLVGEIRDRYMTPHLKQNKFGEGLLAGASAVAQVIAKASGIELTASNLIDSDGTYIAYANGIVKDTKTGLEWKVGPDRDTDWNEARSWVQSLNLDGGGWRMPTMDELEGLYNNGVGSHNITPLLSKITSRILKVWSGETKGSLEARIFRFGSGTRSTDYRDYSDYKRAFAVRSRSDG
jgi:hypothetical protein